MWKKQYLIYTLLALTLEMFRENNSQFHLANFVIYNLISHNFYEKMVGVNFWNFPTVHLRIFSDKAHVETVSSGTRWKIFGCNLKKAQRLLLLTLSKTVLVLLWFVTTTKTRQKLYLEILPFFREIKSVTILRKSYFDENFKNWSLHREIFWFHEKSNKSSKSM